MDAGLPAGALNVITTPAANAEAVSRTLFSDPRVRRANFTGSTRVGRKISEMAGSAMKRVVLELGGKNSLIVRWRRLPSHRAYLRQLVHADLERLDLRPGLHD